MAGGLEGFASSSKSLVREDLAAAGYVTRDPAFYQPSNFHTLDLDSLADLRLAAEKEDQLHLEPRQEEGQNSLWLQRDGHLHLRVQQEGHFCLGQKQ